MNKAKKILFFIANLGAGGAQRSLMTIAKALNDFSDIEVYVATWPEEGDKYVVPSGLHYIDLGKYNRFSSGKINYFLAIYAVRRAIKNFKPDWTVATMSDMYIRTFLGHIGCNSRLIVWEHTSMGRRLHIESRIARRFFYRFADLVLVLTNKDRNLVNKKYKKVDVMPNPLSFPIYKGDNKRENIVVAIGRLDAWQIKGFDRLLFLWKKVVFEHPSWKLMIVGEGNGENTKLIQRMVEENDIKNSVELTGYRTDVQYILCKSKIFVLTSRVEGFPMCLIEAMSQGCACVSFSMQGAVRDIIIDGEDGIIVDDNNDEAFAQVLSDLLSDEVKVKRLSECAINNINRFTPKKVAILWKNILDNLSL